MRIIFSVQTHVNRTILEAVRDLGYGFLSKKII